MKVCVCAYVWMLVQCTCLIDSIGCMFKVVCVSVCGLSMNENNTLSESNIK